MHSVWIKSIEFINWLCDVYGDVLCILIMMFCMYNSEEYVPVSGINRVLNSSVLYDFVIDRNKW